MKRCLQFIGVCLFVGLCLAKDAVAQHKTLLNLGFNNKKELRNANAGGKYKITDIDNGSALRVQSKNTRKRWVSIPLPMQQAQGKLVSVHARVKAENVSVPRNNYNGIKLMLKTDMLWGTAYPQVSLPQGSFDWRNAAMTVYVPKDTRSGELVLGLEESKGTVWFDDLEVSIVDEIPGATPLLSRPAYKGHAPPRLRGMMVTTFANADHLNELAVWGANLVRWQLTWDGFPQSNADTASYGSYKAWLDGVVDHVYRMMPLCRQLGIKVVLDLHTLPGGRMPGRSEFKIFQDKQWQDAFRNIWKELALKFRDEPAIWGYDLANEPNEGTVPAGLMNWQQLAEATVADIRQIDTAHTIIIEAGDGGQPMGLLTLKPVADSKTVYSIHVYDPAKFTHQSLYGNPVNVSYPGLIDGVPWNKQMLLRVLQMVKDWQAKYNKHIYVGEFSAIRWAPGGSAYNYLRDCIDIFEEAGWDWTYHAFREWEGWSVEHSDDQNDKNKTATPNQRQQLFMDWFKKNRQ